jgi:hypothetical protein
MKLTMAQVAHLRKLEKAGRLTPSRVLADAKKKTSPLHSLSWDWNLQRAAVKHWLTVAREVIRSVQIEHHSTVTSFQAPFYVRDEALPPTEEGYVSTVVLKKDKAASRRTVIQELQRAESALNRARHVAATLGLANEIDQLILRVTGLQAVVEKKAAA